jgi:hypothetical protein
MRIATSKLNMLALLSVCAAAAVVFSLTALAAHGRAMPAADVYRHDGPVGGRGRQMAALPLATSVETPEVRIAIQPTQSVVALGESFTVAVAIENAPEISGYIFNMDWDPAVLSVTAAVDAGFLSSPPNFPYGPYITTNTLSFGAAQFPPPAELSSGDGDLAIVTLRTTGVGTSTLRLYTTRVYTRSSPQLWVQDLGDGTVESTCDIAEIVDLAGDSLVDVGEPTHFTATVSGAEPITFTWDFESDGSPERIGVGLDTVTHTYAARGIYTAALTVDNACGVEDRETVSVTVGGPCDPVAITDLASNTPVKIGEAMRFTATVQGTEPYTYTWDFGDGGAGSGTGLDTAMPTWTYTETGGYTVTFAVDNPCGSDEDTEMVRVEPYAIFLPVITKDHP